MARFPPNDIISLVQQRPRFDLAESVGPSLRLTELLGASFEEPDGSQLDYGTAAGDAVLRRAVADLHVSRALEQAAPPAA